MLFRSPFITSDNPVAVRQSGDLRVPMTRYLPITPGLCLSVAFDRARRLPPIDASMAPLGRVNWRQATAQGAKSINRLVAQCAEELVISTAHSVGIESLVRNCARFRVDAEFVTLPTTEPDAVYDGTIIRVREVR